MKKILSLVAAVFLVALIFTVQVVAHADSEHSQHPVTPVELIIKADIYEQLCDRNEYIDVSGYSLSKPDAEKLFNEVIDENARMINAEVYPQFILEADCVDKIFPEYGEDGISLFGVSDTSAEVKKILAYVDDSMSDLEKALAVNDYFAVNYSYDLTYSNYTKEELFTDKTGVCAAYASAYQYILSDVLNIPCIYVPSKAMNHAWNLVYIDNKWYHVDVTWNDPIPDVSGRAMHDYFMLSDAAISDEVHEHYGWTSPYKATSTKYDDYFWAEVEVPLINLGGYFYYITQGGEVNKRNVTTDELNTIYFITSQWPVWDMPGYHWIENYSQVAYYDGLLYVNTPYKILSMDLDGKNIKTVLELDGTDGYIWGLMIKGNDMVYTVSRDIWEYGAESYKTFSLVKKVKCSGNIKAFGDASKEVTLKLSHNGEVVAAMTVTGNSGNYTFENLEKGRYTLSVSKTKHATREYEITVGETDVTQDAVIWLYGDVTADGVINAGDSLQINRKVANMSSVFSQTTDADYRLKIANITNVISGDSIINATDVLQINRKVANMSSVFGNMA